MYAGMGMSDNHTLVTLTTSSEYSGDLHRDFRKLLCRLSRRGVKRRYFAVSERNKLDTCTHLHVVWEGRELPLKIIREEWLKATNGDGRWIHLDKIYRKSGVITYLVKYLTKQTSTVKKRAYWMSGNWVYPGWVRDSLALYSLGYKIPEYKLRELSQKKDRTGLLTSLTCHAVQNLKSHGMYVKLSKTAKSRFRCLPLESEEIN